MSIKINYKSNLPKNNFSNLIFFVDEKYTLTSLKKNLIKSDYEFMKDILASQDLSKKIISFDLSSKKRIFLISLKKKYKFF